MLWLSYQRGMVYQKQGESDKTITDFNKSIENFTQTIGRFYKKNRDYEYKKD